MTAREIAEALGAREVRPDQWMGLCPAHPDTRPSLEITEKDGRTLVRCWAGCPQEAVLDALRARGLWGPHGPVALRKAQDARERTALSLAFWVRDIAQADREAGRDAHWTEEDRARIRAAHALTAGRARPVSPPARVKFPDGRRLMRRQLEVGSASPHWRWRSRPLTS